METRSTIKVLFILYFASAPESESESEPESESIWHPESEPESESEQPYHTTTPHPWYKQTHFPDKIHFPECEEKRCKK